METLFFRMIPAFSVFPEGMSMNLPSLCVYPDYDSAAPSDDTHHP